MISVQLDLYINEICKGVNKQLSRLASPKKEEK